MDCDAFYAAIEKRDDPSLERQAADRGRRSARRGLHRLLHRPQLWRALRHADVPGAEALPQGGGAQARHSYYIAEARQIRGSCDELTPLVEPLSLDEAYLDLSGTERMHGGARPRPWRACARIENEIGITVSIGLPATSSWPSWPRELDKPRGFAVIGMAEARSFLRDKQVGIIRGAGKVLQAKLARDGITTIGAVAGRRAPASWRNAMAPQACGCTGWPRPRTAAPLIRTAR